jgi:hypothetical protein
MTYAVASAPAPPSKAAKRWSNTDKVGWNNMLALLQLREQFGHTYVANTTIAVGFSCPIKNSSSMGAVLEAERLRHKSDTFLTDAELRPLTVEA